MGNEMKWIGGAIFLIAVAIVAIVGNNYGWFGAQPTTVVDGKTVPGGSVIVEDKPDSITLTYNDQDKEDRANDPGTNLRIYSPDLGVTADDGTETLAVSTDYKAIAGNASTTYYAQAVSFNSGTNNQLLYSPALAEAGTLTITRVNKDGITSNAGTAQAIGASEEVEMKVTYDVGSNSYWGSPDAVGKSVVLCEYNQTTVKSVKFDGYTQSAGVPSTTLYTRQANHTAESAWYIPNLVDGEEKDLTMIIESQSTEPTGAHSFLCHMFDANVDLDETTYEIIRGIEDESNNNLTLKPTTFDVILS